MSVSWAGNARDEKAFQEADFLLFHTNGRTPEAVHDEIASMRRVGGFGKPLMINEDGVSVFNIWAAAEERVRQRGFSQLCISAGLENHGARRLYERFGFREIGQPYDDRWSYVNPQGETVHMVERVVDLMKDLT